MTHDINWVVDSVQNGIDEYNFFDLPDDPLMDKLQSECTSCGLKIDEDLPSKFCMKGKESVKCPRCHSVDVANFSIEE